MLNRVRTSAIVAAVYVSQGSDEDGTALVFKEICASERVGECADPLAQEWRYGRASTFSCTYGTARLLPTNHPTPRLCKDKCADQIRLTVFQSHAMITDD